MVDNKEDKADFWAKALITFTGASEMSALLATKYGLLDMSYGRAALGVSIVATCAGVALYNFIYGDVNEDTRAPRKAKGESEE